MSRGSASRDRRNIRGRASGSAFPGRAWEREKTREYLRNAGSQALPGNRCLEALPPDRRNIRGRASRSAFPGRAWERENERILEKPGFSKKPGFCFWDLRLIQIQPHQSIGGEEVRDVIGPLFCFQQDFFVEVARSSIAQAFCLCCLTAEQIYHRLFRY